LVYTGQAVNILGSGSMNITFLYEEPGTTFYIYRIIGTPEFIASGRTAEFKGVGIYALYKS